MSAKPSRDNFTPLHVGQLVRVTKETHIEGLPVRDEKSWVKDITEGVIKDLKRADGGVWVSIVQQTKEVFEFYIGFACPGPILSGIGFRFEILKQAPKQGLLLSRKGAAA